VSSKNPTGVSSIFSGTALFMSEICWRSGVPTEATISEPGVDRVPRSENYSVLRCCSRKGERGLRLEAEGKMTKGKAQMTKSKWRDLWESGKTSSERESKIFSPNLENEGAPQAVFATKRTLEWSKKDF